MKTKQIPIAVMQAMVPFRKVDNTPASCGFGDDWVSALDRAWTNGHYAVLARDIDTRWGKVTHAVIRNHKNTDIPWAAKQRIKNVLFGHAAVAVEVFPPVEHLIDAAPSYHLWVLHDVVLPFGLHKKMGGWSADNE